MYNKLTLAVYIIQFSNILQKKKEKEQLYLESVYNLQHRNISSNELLTDIMTTDEFVFHLPKTNIYWIWNPANINHFTIKSRTDHLTTNCHLIDAYGSSSGLFEQLN